MLQRDDIPNKKWLKRALWDWLINHAVAKQIDFDPKKKYLKDKLWDLIKPAIGMYLHILIIKCIPNLISLFMLGTSV